MFADKTAQNKSVKLNHRNGAAGPQLVQEERSGLEEHRSMTTDGGFKEQAQREASKQLVTSDQHCKNGSILLYRHIFSDIWNGANYFD